MGLTAEATAAQHARPAVAFLTVHDAPPDGVAHLVAGRPPAQLETLIRLTRTAYGARSSGWCLAPFRPE